MKKIIFLSIISITYLAGFSQASSHKKNTDVMNRPGDHFMLQFSSDRWTGTPDSIKSHMSGFSRGANIYIMMNKPFKTNPSFSAAIGIGVGTSHIFFKRMNVDISSNSNKLPFVALDTLARFKKYKLATAYLEIPLELRFTAKPSTPNRTLKAAIGVKVGTLLNAHTKGKTFQDQTNKSLNNNTVKIADKTYFNSTRFVATARIGYGLVSLFGAYNLSPMFKETVAPPVKLLQIGLTISGL